jgi:hypothetical protein
MNLFFRNSTLSGRQLFKTFYSLGKKKITDKGWLVYGPGKTTVTKRNIP